MNTQRLIGLFLIVLGAFGAFYSIRETTLDKNLAAIRQEYLVISGEKQKTDIKTQEDRLSDFYQKAQQILKNYKTSSRANYRLAQAALKLGQNENNENKKTELICAAYQAFSAAATISPLQSDYILGQAESEASLYKNTILCEYFTPTKEHIIATINRSLLNSPFHIPTLYKASEIFLAIQEDVNAFEILQKLQILDTKLSDEKKYFLYSLAKTSDDLALLIPDFLPQIIDWINFFAAQRHTDFIEWQAIFSEKTKNALNNLKLRLDNNDLSIYEYSHFIKQFSNNSLIHLDDSLRKLVDKTLADIYDIEGNSLWSNILKERQSLDHIDVLKAVLYDDKSPETTMISSWYPDTSKYLLSLENNNTSIGIYLPPTSTPALLFIEPLQAQIALDLNNLIFFASEDNLNFYNFSSEVLLSQLIIDGKTITMARIHKPAFRYLKIHLKNTRSKMGFSNSLAELIKVYGVNRKQ